MQGKKSSYLRSAIVQHAVGIPAYVHAGYSVHLALMTEDPTVDDTGTELSGGSYARQEVSWDSEADGRIASDAALTFSNLPACVVTHWALYDAASGGNLLYFGKFEIPLIRDAAQDIEIDAGNFAISEV